MNCLECNQVLQDSSEYIKLNEVNVCVDCFDNYQDMLNEIIESLTDCLNELDFERIKYIYQQL